MLKSHEMEQAGKKLRELNEQEQLEKQITKKVKQTSKSILDRLRSISENNEEAKKVISFLNTQILIKHLFELEKKHSCLAELRDQMKNDREKITKEQLRFVEEKERLQAGIKEIQETILKIQNAIAESVKEEENKKKKMEDDLEISLKEIRDKIQVFEEESEKLQAQNQELRQKKEEINGKLQNLEGDFKKKAEQKDEGVKKEKEDLMENLKAVEEEVNEATTLNKAFAALEKENFDHKVSIYFRTKKFPDFSTSFESSASTIDKCKQQLMKGVDRLNIAQETIQKCESKTKQLTDVYLDKFKTKGQKEQKIEFIKKQKAEVRLRIIDLQKKLKQKKSEN